MLHCLVLLLEAISWSRRVIPHRKNLPFAAREVTQTKYFNCTPPGGHRFPVWGFICLQWGPKRNGGCEEGSGPIQGDRKFRHPASFPFAMKGSCRKWIPGVPKIKGCFLTPQREMVGVRKVLVQSKVTENSGTLPASSLQ